MCVLEVYVQCNDRFFEVSPLEAEVAELTVEDAVSRVLLDLFGEGSVEEVNIRFSSNPYTGLQKCFIQIRALCDCQQFILRPRTKVQIERSIEKCMGSLLRELFGLIKVDGVLHCPSLALLEHCL